MTLAEKSNILLRTESLLETATRFCRTDEKLNGCELHQVAVKLLLKVCHRNKAKTANAAISALLENEELLMGELDKSPYFGGVYCEMREVYEVIKSK